VIWVDYVIVGIIALSTVMSLVRGFVREALSLALWVLAFWVAFSFFRDLAVYLEPHIAVPSARLGAAFAILFLTTLILGALINFLIVQLVQKTGLSGTDRLLGMLFGATRGVLLVAIMVLLAGLTALPNDDWWKHSQLIPYFQQLALWLRNWLPEDIAQNFSYA